MFRRSQAGFGFAHDVQTRQADLIRARSHPAEDLRRHDDVFALHAERFAKQGFGFTAGIHVGGVDEVDAGVERVVDQRVHIVLREAADGFENASRAAERHGAEADARDENSGVAKLSIFHGIYSKVYADS